MLAGKGEHRHHNAPEVATLVEADETTHRRTVGRGRHGAHAVDGKRAPGRIGTSTHYAVDDIGGELRHGLAEVERSEPVGEKFLLEVSGRIAEGGARS